MPEFETTRCFNLAGFVEQLRALAAEVGYCITPEYRVVLNFEDEGVLEPLWSAKNRDKENELRALRKELKDLKSGMPGTVVKTLPPVGSSACPRHGISNLDEPFVDRSPSRSRSQE
uniref:Uncharacterized protein n=1 Tax=Oryza rufipogon TaxID=4529 RepID=A0A0E0NE19_ORYRU